MTAREQSEQATDSMYARQDKREQMERFREIDYTDEQREYASKQLKKLRIYENSNIKS